MKNAFYAFFLLAFVSWRAFGQPAPSPVPSPPPAPEEKKKATDYNSMVESTLAQDIETASFYELVAWCRLLGLDEAGDKPALVQKLKTHFNIQAADQKKEILKRIRITSARTSEYFRLEDAKEDYVLIQGNAVIVLADTKDNTTHTISAERVLYNQTKNTISASGNVLYTRKIGDKEEAFTGETFVFDVENWEGVLYYAQGERKKKMEEKEVLFRYSGKTVTRLKDNSIILEDGVITSSANRTHPHYRITASRICVYGPGEWSIENAVLYIGNIPFLYIPFYFYSSDEIFFNPVVGVRLREGAFLQNTLYLIGKKTREGDALSFLQLEEAGGENYEMELDGLFLRPARKQASSSAAAAPASSASVTPAGAPAEIKHLKFFADAYSRLGFFTGVSLDASPAFKLFGGIGVSRSIFYTTNYGYTSYYLDQNYWNSGYFFNIYTPFRFGLETEFNTSGGILTRFSGSLKLFSDTYFPSDFYTRQESQDFGKMLGFDLSSQTAPSTTVTSASQQQNITWKLDLGLNFASLVKSPLFQTLKIDPFSVTFDWSSKSVPNPALDPVISADPTRLFYYPQRFIFPNFTVGVGGTIFTHTVSNEVTVKPATRQPDSSGPDVLPPIAPDAAPAAEQPPPPDSFDLRQPAVQSDVPIDRTMKYFFVNTAYSLSHLFKAEHLFSSVNWTRVEDITYFTTSSIFDHSGTSALNYQVSFLNATLDLTGNFTLLDKFKTTFIPYQGFNQTLSDTTLTGLDLTKNITFSYSPFKPYLDFKDTKLSYTLKWDFYDIYASGGLYYDRLLEFSRNTVGVQKISASFIYQPEDKANSLVISANIPPVLGLVQAELNFHLWIFQTTVSGGYRELLSGSWVFDQVIFTEKAEYEKYFSVKSTYKFDPETQSSVDWSTEASFLNYKYLDKDRYLLSQELAYNFSYDSFTNSLTTLNLWDIKFNLLFKYMVPQNALGMQLPEPSAFLLYTCSLSYFYELPLSYFWRNRGSFSASVNTALNLNFQKVVDSNFTLGLKLNFKIHQFAEIEFTAEVYNNNIYRYIPPFVDAVNQAYPGLNFTPVNPLEDLLRSFNFFNIEDRYNSFFKLKKLGLGFVHHLDDWDFTVTFSGEFKNMYNTSTNSQSYEWIPAITFSLKWLGIPQIKKEVSADGTLEGFKVN